jgi:peptidylprolyl isomerase
LQYGASLQGSGATVKKGQSIVIQLMGIDWQTAKTFADTWSTHTAQTVVVTPATDTSAGGIPSGVVTALVGQKVGSQVVVIVPPKEGFAAGKNPSGVTDGDTLVFVIDILGIQ